MGCNNMLFVKKKKEKICLKFHENSNIHCIIKTQNKIKTFNFESFLESVTKWVQINAMVCFHTFTLKQWPKSISSPDN